MKPTIAPASPALQEAAGNPAIPLQRLDFTSRLDRVSDWAVMWTCGDAGRPWWVFVHGHGSTGDQLWTRQDLHDTWWPLAAQLRLNVLAVNTRGNAWMGPAAAADLHALLAWLRETHGASQCILASGSMGGTSSLIYAAVHPEDVAGVIALCPATDLARYYAWCRQHHECRPILDEIATAIAAGYGGAPGQAAKAYKLHSACRQANRLTMPIYVAHGTEDATIPVCESRYLAGALATHPAFTYQEMPGGSHESPLARMPEAMAWMLNWLDS